MSARRHHYCLRHCWLMLAGWLLIVLQAHATTLAVDQQTPYQSLVPWLQQCLTTATVDSPATLDTKSCRHGRFTAVDPRRA
jgi:hypothetical protein